MNYKKRFLSYLLPQKRSIFFIAISVLIFSIGQLSQPLFVGYALDAALNDDSKLFYIFVFLSLGLSILAFNLKVLMSG